LNESSGESVGTDSGQGTETRDLVQIGASTKSREVLERLRDSGYISDLMDGYRLAIAVAIGFGRSPRLDVPSETENHVLGSAISIPTQLFAKRSKRSTRPVAARRPAPQRILQSRGSRSRSTASMASNSRSPTSWTE